MAKLILTLICIFLLGMAQRKPEARVEIPYKTQNVVKILATIVTEDGKEKRAEVCTGFVWGTNRVLTARHCVDPKFFGRDKVKDFGIEFKNNTESSCKFVQQGLIFPSEDWAILECKTWGVKPLKLAKKWPTIPFQTYYVSYRLGKLRVIPVNLIRYEGEEGYLTMVYQGITLGGDSGSPLFNAKGEVLGLVTRSTFSSESPLGFAVPFLYLPRFN